MIPDFAAIRDRAKAAGNKVRHFWYTIFSFGWIGTAKNWQRIEEVSLVLAGISTPLVLSVHSVVSMDFATSLVPGWHTTIFPPYFVAGAIFSGFAMVQTLMIITRKVLNMEEYITIYHIDMMNRIILLTGSIVGVAYLTEFFIAWYSGVEYEQYAFMNRATGPYWWAYWSMMTCNVITPQLFWSARLRNSVTATFIIAIFVNIGMWFERFVIIVTSLHRDYVPSSWVMYYPTWVEIGIFLGSLGLFFTCYLLFARFCPVIALSELKTVVKSSSTQAKRHQSQLAEHHKKESVIS
jgi:molybdopterin-containing oxidoreductase family membrane subunit